MPHRQHNYYGQDNKATYKNYNPPAQHQNPAILTVSVAGEGASARGKKGKGDTVHSFDAATYIQWATAAGARIHLCPENSVDVFLPPIGCILQLSKTTTREYRRHVPGRPREQEQEQALQPFQKQHFPFSKKWKGGGGRENDCEQLLGGRCRLKIRIRTPR